MLAGVIIKKTIKEIIRLFFRAVLFKINICKTSMESKEQ